MLFNSHFFIIVFLPICLIGYFLFNKHLSHKWAKVFLIGMSLWFYAYFNVKYLAIIITSVLFNFYVGRLLHKDYSKNKRKAILFFALFINLGILFCFKYFDFFISSINQLFGTSYNLLYLVLPLGISFFTFQQISYIVDSYRNNTDKYSFIDFALFVVFFPQLIAGPIVLHNEIIPQLEDPSKYSFNFENFNKGLYGFSIGLAKKVIIADTVGQIVNSGYNDIASLNATIAIIVLVCYTFQIYFDFSAYSDMAIGIGRMLNIEIPINFNSPYKSKNIDEFWSRNHITLTRFFRTYVYFPLGGNRKGKFRTYLNQLIVFTLSGLWHGAGLTFIAWGFLHGVAKCIVRGAKSTFARIPAAISVLMNFVFCTLAWAFFRAATMKDAFAILGKVFSLQFANSNTYFLSKILLPEFSFITQVLGVENLFLNNPNNLLVLTIGICLILCYVLFFCKNTSELVSEFKPTTKNLIVIVFLLVLSITSFNGVSTFLYYNF